MKGRLFLIPSPLGENEPSEVLAPPIFAILPDIKIFIVEQTRTARRFLSKAGLKGNIDGLVFFELNEHTHIEDVERYASVLENGEDVALISEAGLPAVADPGASLVRLAHSKDIEIIPFVGPSSLMLALMSSGLNGQSFAFTGYLPVKGDKRKNEIKRIEKISAQTGQTQIIIETPYRNDSLLADMLSVCHPDTDICVAADITLPEQYIKTLTVSQWRKKEFKIGKRPCVFVLSASKKI